MLGESFVIGVLYESWLDCVKPAVMDGLQNPALILAMQPLRSWFQKELALLHPAPQPQTHEAAVAAPQAKLCAKNKKKTSQRTLERGRICVQIKDEMKTVRHMTREGGKNIADIRAERPDFRFWKFVKSPELSEEDRETALHPNQWSPGYPNLLLSKYFGVSVLRIRDYVTAYNSTLPNKKTSCSLISH